MISVFKKILDFIMVFLIVSGSFVTLGSRDGDLQKISDNIVMGLIDGTLAPFQGSDINDAETIISLIEYDSDGNCRFSDVDYENTSRSDWVTKRHLNRTGRLAVLYRRETDEALKDEYRDYVLKLIDHWVKNDYQNSNWWFNKLATPNTLGEIALLMKDDLSLRQFTAVSEIVGRGSFSVNYQVRDYTGANTTDIAMSTIKFAALTDSRTSVRTAVRLVEKQLEYSDGEGLKTDGTFFQHGNRLYMGGYGISFISGIADLMFILDGTKYELSPELLGNVASFIVDGLAVMSFGSILDPTTMGRSVSRYSSQPLAGLAKNLKRLAAFDSMPRKDEILAYASRIENNVRTDTGVHYFEKPNFICINNSDFYFSFRGGYSDIVYSEKINEENVLSYNSSFPGVTTIMSTGNEYLKISPVYDYSMIPGATAAYESDEELFAKADYSNRKLDGVYGGYEADGFALSFAQTTHDGISMTVACFATDSAAVLLGAGFSDSANRELITTIDQSYFTGEYISDGNTVIHNGIKYTLIEGGTPEVSAEIKTGSWYRNNRGLSQEPVNAEVFTLSFKNTGAYAYSVMAENTDKEFTVLCNNEKAQAVLLPDGRVAAAFYDDYGFVYEGRTYSGKAGSSFIG